MRDPVASFSNVPFGADLTIYLVVDGFGDLNAVNRERQIERPDLENVLADLMAGLFHDPIRVVAFNTLEHWSKDISTDVAQEIQCRCDCEGLRPPQYLAGFMETHLDRTSRPVQRFVV
jgi:hypothetical protein